MNLRTWLNRDSSLALAAAAAVGLAVACTDLTEPGKHQLGDPAPELSLDLAAAGGVPQGPLTLENFKLIVDTVGNSDVFQRAGADGYYSLSATRYYFHTGVRIAGEDPRLPALEPVYNPDGFVTQFAYTWGQERYNDPLWDWYMRWDGLEPVATYTYAIERLATIVNGAPDALEYIIEGEVTEPDELVPVGGTPGGYPDNDYGWTSRDGCKLEPIPDPPPNPWYLGAMTASSDGRITADYCMGSPWLWYTGTVNVPDSSVVAPNELRLGVTPEYQYNYVVVYKGEPPNLGDPIIRIQIGVDLDTNGNPLPNGFAPFPVAADREAALTLPNVQAAPSRIRFEMRDLKPLEGGTDYEVWLVNQEDGSTAPATARYFTIETIIETDELGQQIEVDVPSADTVETATFAGVPESNIRHAFIVNNRSLGGPTLGEFTHVALAKPGTSGALTEPVMWGQYLDQGGTPGDPSDDIFITSDDLKFGELDLTDVPDSRTFRGAGSGDGLIWENELAIQFRRLRRPPPGYIYQVWLTGESANTLPLGSITGPKSAGYMDIDDADEVVHPGFMTNTEIVQAAKVVSVESIDLSQYEMIMLTLEPKAGVEGMGPTLTLSGALPAINQ